MSKSTFRAKLQEALDELDQVSIFTNPLEALKQRKYTSMINRFIRQCGQEGMNRYILSFGLVELTPLGYAIKINNVNAVRYLLKMCVNVEVNAANTGDTPMSALAFAISLMPKPPIVLLLTDPLVLIAELLVAHGASLTNPMVICYAINRHYHRLSSLISSELHPCDERVESNASLRCMLDMILYNFGEFTEINHALDSLNKVLTLKGDQLSSINGKISALYYVLTYLQTRPTIIYSCSMAPSNLNKLVCFLLEHPLTDLNSSSNISVIMETFKSTIDRFKYLDNKLELIRILLHSRFNIDYQKIAEYAVNKISKMPASYDVVTLLRLLIGCEDVDLKSFKIVRLLSDFFVNIFRDVGSQCSGISYIELYSLLVISLGVDINHVSNGQNAIWLLLNEFYSSLGCLSKKRNPQQWKIELTSTLIKILLTHPDINLHIRWRSLDVTAYEYANLTFPKTNHPEAMLLLNEINIVARKQVLTQLQSDRSSYFGHTPRDILRYFLLPMLETPRPVVDESQMLSEVDAVSYKPKRLC